MSLHTCLKNNAVEINNIKARRLFDQNDVCKQAPFSLHQSKNLCITVSNLFEVCLSILSENTIMMNWSRFMHLWLMMSTVPFFCTKD